MARRGFLGDLTSGQVLLAEKADERIEAGIAQQN